MNRGQQGNHFRRGGLTQRRGRGNYNRGSPRVRGYRGHGREAFNNRVATSRDETESQNEGEMHVIRPIGYKLLEEMVNDDDVQARHITLRLSTEQSGFAKRLVQDDLGDGMIQMLLRVMGKMCKNEEPSPDLNHVLQIVLNSKFEYKAISFLNNLHRDKRNSKQKIAEVHISNCLYLLRAYLIYAQNSAERAVSVLLVYVKDVVSNMELGSYADIDKRLQEIDELVEDCYRSKQNDANRKKHKIAATALLQLHDEEPPDNFRNISVFPTCADINCKEDPFVRSNLVNSAYRSSDHYLDVQFRLLREDFIRPLREGIKEFFTTDGDVRRRRPQGVKVYENVKIQFPTRSQKGINYCIHFDVERLQFVQWQNSKRLLYGNLICLSSDNFQRNFLFASVTNRDVECLKNGFITVEFFNMKHQQEQLGIDDDDDADGNGVRVQPTGRDNLVSKEDMEKTYYMVESEAYFEAYRHVLAGLQETRNIPLSQYLIQCESIVRAPYYLRGPGKNVTYDFSSIIFQGEKKKVSKRELHVLNTEMWPDAEELKLDTSQVTALKTALTHELAVIQGPPGTGKTHVGLIIMKMLLGNMTANARPVRRDIFHRMENLELANIAKVPNAPILVVCYTNHALDQFLEGIAKFHPQGLIRVGGRCKTKSLEQYSLNVVRRKSYGNQSRFLKKTIFELKSSLEGQDAMMEESDTILQVSTQSILPLHVLQSVIQKKFVDQLYAVGSGNDDPLVEWLPLKKNLHALPESSFVVPETLMVFAKPFIDMGFDLNHIIQAMMNTGQTDEGHVVPWLLTQQYIPNGIDSFDTTEFVYDYLARLTIPFRHDHLNEMGFQEHEIKCAWLATDSLNENFIAKWIEDKRASIMTASDDEEEVFQIEEEAAYMQEQRMVDEIDDWDQFTRNRKRNKDDKRRIFEKFSAIKFEEHSLDKNGTGWEIAKSKGRSRDKKHFSQTIKEKLGKVDVMSRETADGIRNIHVLNADDKWKLYRLWVNDLRIKLRNKLGIHAVEYNRLAKALADIRTDEDFDVLKTANVIGMTTTGAAKYRNMVNKLPVKIMIVEEAAEVLEAHIVTSMPQTVEHLILIGDHQQLKPSPTVYELARKFNLDVSLFERMLKNGLPCSKLALQHRMRPRIADLIRPHIYKELRDHESVMNYEEITGVQKSLFFLSHEHQEDNVLDGRSKVNQHEADFMVGLCRYLMQQGYLAEQITILTAYVGQLFAFKKVLAKRINHRVRVTAVDNFQGEESDIILLSLVRSNEQGKIGFLNVENRVCVALSRAKKGLYCIGNFEMLKENSKLWYTILRQLEKDELSGDALPLQCKNHPDCIIKVKNEKDFDKVPEGGCGKKCEYRLECGHVCTRLCHPDDENHKNFKCRKPCEKFCENEHKCKRKCFEACKCVEVINKVVPRCGHLQEMLCSQNPSGHICLKPCSCPMKQCGHKCTGKCGTECSSKCYDTVEVKGPCGHLYTVPCHASDKINPRQCKQKCTDLLKCGHMCKGSCGECLQGCLHAGCNKKCERTLFCGHVCKENCSLSCPPCQMKCETECKHSKCPKSCCEPCNLCIEKCDWKCKHHKCKKLCSEPCDRPPCNQPCEKILKCKHPCVGLCGEPCPKLCRVCDKVEVTEIFFGDEDEPDARFVQLECGHMFTYDGLDTWMEQDNSDGSEEVNVKLKECPRCKTPIRKSKRYGRIVNKQLCLINEVRKQVAGETQLIHKNRSILYDVLKNDTNVHQKFPLQMKNLKRLMSVANSLSQLAVNEMRYNCLLEFAAIKGNLDKLKLKPDALKLIISLTRKIDEACTWLFKDRSYFSEQEQDDIKREKMRYKHTLELIQIMDKCESVEPTSSLALNSYIKSAAKRLLTDLSPYSLNKEDEVLKRFKQIKKIIPHVIPGLGITESERKMIIQAVGLSPGHWYQCKNGHIYCIGECGGATESTKCPTCKETIGGQSHTLAEGNTVATSMSGATRSAWDPDTFTIPHEVREWMLQ